MVINQAGLSKNVGPSGVSMGDIIRARLPFLILIAVAMAVIMIFPNIALWLPSVMH
jgi:TRAP-type mannitol/chloroaromatic compound transport system permease large subunit